MRSNFLLYYDLEYNFTALIYMKFKERAKPLSFFYFTEV